MLLSVLIPGNITKVMNYSVLLQIRNFHAQVSLHFALKSESEEWSKKDLAAKQVFCFRPTIPFSGPILTIKVGQL